MNVDKYITKRHVNPKNTEQHNSMYIKNNIKITKSWTFTVDKPMDRYQIGTYREKRLNLKVIEG